ncbi:insulinase family protein [Dehalococcoidia bacterium]|nr:insulinase family protein [Dehalococcoidia bacterium]
MMQNKRDVVHGLPILVQPIDGAKSVMFGIGIPVGAVYEKDEEAGSSHFVEHLVLGATRGGISLIEQIEALGGTMYGVTGLFNTTYFVQSPPDTAEDILRVFFRGVFNSVFDNVDSERKIIIEEMQYWKYVPRAMLQRRILTLMYPNHPLGRPIIGTESALGNITKMQLISWYRKWYQPQDSVLVATGAIRPGEVARWVEKWFNSLPLDPPKRDIKLPEFETPLGIIDWISAEQMTCHLAVGFRYPHQDARGQLLLLLDAVTGWAVSSRFFHILRQEGKIYGLHTKVFTQRFLQNQIIFITATPQKIKGAADLLAQEIQRLIEQGISEDEWEQSKKKIAWIIRTELEHLQTLTKTIIECYLEDKTVFQIDETLGAVSAIPVEEINGVARTLYRKENRVGGLVSPREILDLWAMFEDRGL